MNGTIKVGSRDVPLIDDSNFDKLVQLVPGAVGYGFIPRDWTKIEYGAVPYSTAVSLPLIDWKEWDDRIDQHEANKSSLDYIIDDVGVPKMYQNGVGYCHAFSITHAAMCLRARMNLPFVRLSPSSIGGPVTNYRNAGAWIIDDLKQAVEGGFSETKYYAELTTKNVWTNEARSSAARNKVIQTPEGGSEWWEHAQRNPWEAATVLLSNFPMPVGLNWWAHSVNGLKLVRIRPKVYGILYQNSHSPDSEPGDGRLVIELIDMTNPNKPRLGKGVPDEAYTPRQMTPSQPLGA